VNIIQGLDFLHSSGHKGDWCFMPDNITMFIKYGDEQSDVCAVRVAGEGAWQWNGSKEKPTLSPSIKVSNSERVLWHGFLKEGIIIDV
jgi:hypothetical protein